MCSNYEPIYRSRAPWVKQTFQTELPEIGWREETYPGYLSPFIYMDNGKPRCVLARFGLVPFWAAEKKNFGLSKYNARLETVTEKPTFRSAWSNKRFGLVLMESFFEPNWESGKAIRWRISRADGEPSLAACIWEEFTDKTSGEIVTSFSMLTLNADGHEVMKHFHKKEDEKRSIVILKNQDYMSWLDADHSKALELLTLAPNGFLRSEPAPKPTRVKELQTASLL